MIEHTSTTTYYIILAHSPQMHHRIKVNKLKNIENDFEKKNIPK